MTFHSSSPSRGAAAASSVEARRRPILDAAAAAMEQAAAVSADIRRKLFVDVHLDVDWDGFAALQSGGDTRPVFELLASTQLQNLRYLLESIAPRCPLAARLRRIRFEPARRAEQHAIYGFADTIVFHVDPRDWSGFVSEADLERILPTMIHGLDGSPALQPTLTPPADATAAEAIDTYLERFLPGEKMRLFGSVSPALDVRVDVDALAGDAEGARWLPIWGLQRVAAAVESLPDAPHVIDALLRECARVELRFVREASMKSCRASGGALVVAIAPALGEKGCFYERDVRDVLAAAVERGR